MFQRLVFANEDKSNALLIWTKCITIILRIAQLHTLANFEKDCNTIRHTICSPTKLLSDIYLFIVD